LINDDEIRSVEAALLTYLSQHADVGTALDERTDLLASGILDSLLITDLVAFMQRAYGIQLTAYDISPEHLGTIASMARLVHDKRHKTKRAA